MCACIQLPSCLTEEHHDLVVELFDWLVQPCLDYVRLHCKTLLSCSLSHLVVMLIRLYECLVDKIITSSYQTDIELITNSQVSLSVWFRAKFGAIDPCHIHLIKKLTEERNLTIKMMNVKK